MRSRSTAQRAEDRRHAPLGPPDGRRADFSAVGEPGSPRHPRSAQFPNTLPTFLIGGYQQLGSPPNTATDFSTSVTQIADTLTWLKGRHTHQGGRRPALGAAQRPPAAVADRVVHLQHPLHRPAGHRQHRHAAGELPPRTGAAVLDRPAAGGDPEPRALPGVLRPGRLAVVRSRHDQRRPALHAEFPVDRREQSGGGLQPQTPAARVSGPDGNPRAARQLHTLNFGPRFGIVGRVTDRTVVRSGYAMVWIEMAGITTPFTTPVFPFLQTVSQRTLDNIMPAFVLANGPQVEPIPLTPDAGLGQGVFSVDRDLGSGYVQQWNPSLQRELTAAIAVEVAYIGIEDHARGHSRHQPESADGRSACAGRVAPAARAESVLRYRSPARRRWATRRSRSRSCSSHIRSSRRSASIATTSGRRSTMACTPSWSSDSRAGCRISSAIRDPG